MGCVDLCWEVSFRMSANYFKTYFIESYLILWRDKCENIVLNFIDCAEQISRKIPLKEKKYYDKLVQIL